jgi:hypothetical protein
MTKHFGRVLLRVAMFAGWAGIAVMPASADVILYNQPTNLQGAYASQFDTSTLGLGNFATAYDDFILPAGLPGYSIDDVQWVGSYFFNSPVGVITAFTLNFFANNGGIPGALLPGGSFSVAGNAGETCNGIDQAGNITCSYLVNIPDFVLASGTPYWLSIVPNLGLLPQWGWETGTGGNDLAYTCFFGTCGTGSINGTAVPNDLAFELSGHPVPEPSSLLLLAGGLSALALVMCRKKSMKLSKKLGRTSLVVLASVGSVNAQTWTPTDNAPATSVGPMLQLRDGRILVQDHTNKNAWLILTPNQFGNYVNGVWSFGGMMPTLPMLPPNPPTPYAPLYFGSQVLLNGRQVVIQGGEFNDNLLCPNVNGNQSNQVFLGRGAIGTVTPFGGPLVWTPNAPPGFFGGANCFGETPIGDAQSIILANGRYMQANAVMGENAIFNGPNAWLMAGPPPVFGSVNQTNNDQSAFTLLTNDKVLTVDTSAGCANRYELYDQGTGTWTCGANQIFGGPLYDPNDRELGAAVLMYNNMVFQFGGSVPNTATYDVTKDKWFPGPGTPPPPCCLFSLDPPLDQSDGPAALEPNGKVLAMLSPGPVGGSDHDLGAGNTNPHCQFVEYDPSHPVNGLVYAPNPTHCFASFLSPGTDPSYVGHLMILPTGQIMFTDFTNLVQVYSPAPGVVPNVAATVFLPSTILYRGSTNNIVYGYQLNGLTQNNAYGDDYQADTNFPLARLTCRADIAENTCPQSNVFYAFTHDDSTHSIKPGTFGFTLFDLPANMPPGAYQFVTVTNGIQSNPIGVNVR